MALDRFAHRTRMRGEEERGEVDPARVERELGPHAGPIPQVWRGLCLVDPAERGSARDETRAGEQVAAVELSHTVRDRDHRAEPCHVAVS